MTVVDTANVKRSVGDPATVYTSMQPLWKKSRAIINGERFTKDYDRILDTSFYTNLLIPFSPSMTQEQYNFYLAEAELPGVVGQYARIVIGGLLRKQPQLKFKDNVKVPEEAVNWILNNFTQDNLPMASFLDTAVWEELQTSRAWVYVDYPKIEGYEDLDKETRNSIKPYPVIWNAESIINWRVSANPLTGAQQLQQVIIRNYEEVFRPELGEFHPVFLDTVWVHELDTAGYYQIRKFQEAEPSKNIVVSQGKIQQNYITINNEHFQLVETNTSILMNGERLNKIPAWPLNGKLEMQEPMLMPLIAKEVSLYNKISRRNHLLYGAATYTPYVSSNMSDSDFESIVSAGLGSWIKLQQGDAIGVLDTPTGALTDMDRSISATFEEMAKLGVRMLTPETSQSGVALDIRNAAQTAQLGSLNTKVSNQISAIIAFMINWRYGLDLSDGDVEFEMSADFNPAPLGADWLRLCTEWYEKGYIPRSVWLQMLKQNDMLPPEYDDESGVMEINNDEMITTPQEQMDYQKRVQAMAGLASSPDPNVQNVLANILVKDIEGDNSLNK